ncbi:uncharacterized protein F5Z01DRAFT_41476 [Emericellopsis atlantica]|uniref:RFX-type winged-helix domain-containing protein n=1 Tax=Emericellopsis atlantica TaxID=2614577 RepID=A0A9P7ZN97_9HYPO|nr:uncharacterized protein F5Z01DRAFT_41476 [Emericellopsis atlantica]KAG9255244.1 hypothetical protein F5Z01DRAFT_41476 [Emericellopsis atlantica]
MDQHGSLGERPGSGTRPRSQDSTTSTRSITTQHPVDPNSFLELSNMYANQWHRSQHHNMQPRRSMSSQQLGSEAMLVHATHQLQGGPNGFSMGNDGRLSQHPAGLQPHHGVMPNRGGSDPHGLAHIDQVPWDDADISMMETGDGNENMDFSRKSGAKDSKKSKKRSNANNDGEMRDLFDTNKAKSLEDVANELRGNERGPKAERKRQLYAMLWLNASCVESKNSIPRGRVYSMYASQCSDDRVIVLNPASFGKLVRILFPNIQTRRLGVRGESKYHYVNFDLKEQPATERGTSRPFHAPNDVPTEKSPEVDFNTTITKDPAPPSTQLPRLDDVAHRRSETRATDSILSSKAHSRYNMPHTDINTPCAKTPLQLSFMNEADRAADSAEPITLPSIGRYLPANTDTDAAQSLTALYRSHCTSIVESLRYCREKSFFHLYECFHGTLTTPVQRLFAHPKIAGWIEECDILLYQRCTRLIAHLSHQVIPQRVMSSMRKISERLVGHIHESFRGQPSHVLEAKIGPATVFAGIMDRMLRVNVSAHAMVREMTNVANRDQMFVDWVQNINPRKIAECVPTWGMDDVVNLLLTELRDLLEPENVPQTEDFAIYMSSRSQELRQNGQEPGRRATGRSHIERLEAFLMSLPSKFPYASHADIAWCVERVGTTIVRDLTIGGLSSFSSWLVLKVFIDEEIWFLAEAGGFLRTTSIRGDVGQDDSEAPSKRVSSSSGAVPDNAGPTESALPLIAAPTSPRVSNRAPFPPKPTDNFADTTPDVHDDSGIGIRTPDTDFHKFTFGNAEQLVDVDGVLDGAGRSDRPDELMMNA